MANYKEELISGQSWVRCRDIYISNPLQVSGATAPMVVFTEEKIAILADQKVTLGVSTCSKVFESNSGLIEMRNPLTDELLGTTVSHAELYAILYSLYLQTAIERDTAPITPTFVTPV